MCVSETSQHPHEQSGGQAAETSVKELLDRMRRGDRDAAARFVLRYGDRLRRRVRAKLSRPMQRLFDSQDILSTVARRLDGFVRDGRMRAEDEPQLWSLLHTISDNALIDKARVFRRLQAAEGDDGPLARQWIERLREAEQHEADGAVLEIDRILATIADPIDRQILCLWLKDLPHAAIGEEVGLAATAVRKRWQVIRERLRERFESARSR